MKKEELEAIFDDGDRAWAGWLMAISLLGLRDLVPLADNAFREGRIPEEWTDRRQFDDDIAVAESAPDDIERFTQYKLGYIEESRRRDAGRPKPQCAVIQARASRWAVAISASDIIAATSRRIEMASARPFRAARLNHLWAATRFTTPERPLAQ
jgi:hypothetical protein